MKKLFLLFSHTLTSAQEKDAKERFGVEQFVILPTELQMLWSNVPSDLDTVIEYLEPLKKYLEEEVKEGDVVLVQGDFGATYYMVNVVKALGVKAVHATTKRNVVEQVIANKIVKTSVFEHVRFRIYV
jgi:D-arabinose 1-dehydrogenase-like Zn-dependent alcohol dehydrogenase